MAIRAVMPQQTMESQQRKPRVDGESELGDRGAEELAWLEPLKALLRTGLAHTQQQVHADGHSRIACMGFSVPVELNLLGSICATSGAAFRSYWRATDGRERAMLGVCQCTTADGPAAVMELAQGWDAVRTRFTVFSGGHACAFGGVAFAPGLQRDRRWKRWPGASLTVPRLLFETDPVGLRLTVNAIVDADSDIDTMVGQCLEWVTKAVKGNGPLQDYAGEPVGGLISFGADAPERDVEQELAYERAVSETARDIREGRLRKVVLARRADYPVEARDRLEAAMATLSREHPDSTVFLWGQSEDVFVGAAPERLIRVADGQVSIDCLAGTAPRSNDASEDQRLGRKLYESTKNQDEHRAVVEGVLMSGADFASTWQVPSAPRLLSLGHVQHLFTPLTATLRPGKTVLDAVAALHPTPAVAGTPRDLALAAIAARETIDRGYYAGPVGFVEGDGSGEFVVALRCALLGPLGMSLFAGGGIMGESDPASERAETEWKMRAIRSAFGLTGLLDHKEGDL